MASPQGYIPNNSYVPDGQGGYMLDPNRTFRTDSGVVGGAGGSGMAGGLASLLAQMGGRAGGMGKPRSAVSTYGQSPLLAAQQQGAAQPRMASADEGMLGAARQQALADFMKQGGLDDIRRRPGMTF